MKQFYCCIFLSLLCAQVVAQTATVSGRVHTADGTGLSHVTLRVAGTSLTAISDKDGAYELSAVPFGKQRLLITSLEIEPVAHELAIDRPRHTLHIPLQLKDGTDIDEVLIVKDIEKRQMEISGFAVAVIETKEASVRNLTTNELLDRAVGVRVRQNGGIGAHVEYNLNGMSGNTVGLFLDGIEVSTYGQSFNLNNIPPSMIERIEVYKGVLPSHLTGDYAGGAINVVLKKDAAQNNVTFATSYGSFNTFQTDASATFRDKRSGLSGRVSGFHTYTDNSFTTWGRSTTYVNHLQQITRPYRAKRFNDAYRSLGGRFEAGFTDVAWADHFFLGYNLSENYNEIPHGTTMATPYVGRFNETKAHVFSLNYHKQDWLADGLSLTVNAVRAYRSTYLQDTVGLAYNWDGTVREVIEFGERVPLRTTGGGQQGERTQTQIDRRIWNARSNLRYAVAPGHRVSLNHKIESTDRDDQDLLNQVHRDLVTASILTKNILSLNYEAQAFNNTLRTNLLGKYTANSTKRNSPVIIAEDGQHTVLRRDTSTFASNFGYGATVSYQVIPKLFVIASAENGYVMPGERQMYGEPEGNILPNLNLKPEKNINYNLGGRWGTLDWGKHRFSFYGSAFWRSGYDKITQQAVDEATIETEGDADIQTTRYVNLGRTQALGVEGEFMYSYADRLHAMLNFSKFNNLFKGGNDVAGASHDYYNEQVPNEPFFTVNANIQYRTDDVFQRGSTLNLHYNTGFVGQYYVVWGEPEWSKTPAQFTHDIGASYRFPSGKLIASVDAKNILNAEIYDNFMVQKPGRGIYFKLNYTISKFL